jgi:hypothetical protein
MIFNIIIIIINIQNKIIIRAILNLEFLKKILC